MARFDCAIRTDVGHKRAHNEDAVLQAPGADLWAVADGMGGHHAGEVASAMVVERLGAITGGGLEQMLGHALQVLDGVNAELVRMARTSYRERVIGSTVVGLVAADDGFACFWAGDSRAYLVRGGAITRLTRDHSLVQNLIDAGMLDEASAETHPNANVVTRAVGARDELQVDTSRGALEPGDLFLLASDGLTRLVHEEELLAILSALPPQDAADRLIARALECGAPDNVSVIVVRAA
ncbi:serine/threonine-protein phosphatase [Novosphingobium flavum]|uniref:Serine/threonine-protein phosphatase n=1 Tax=Novosphingobium flavum TaxID=1778672 RepID=A0A7X1FR47_9SPHN|nr:protein phosphatase 2C domain-containing protein [Novosphingobium flavum]MBC2665274.1 serine/threonine-protein phosphatase [Novosphingobium flavum]